MEDVTDQNENAVSETSAVETTTQPSATGEQKTTGAGNDGGTQVQPSRTGLDSNEELARYRAEVENLKKALKQERGVRKNLQRRGASSNAGTQGLAGESMDEIFSNPAVQDLLVKNAEYQMKEGLDEILSQYPQLPKAVVNAIKRNPRGYVRPETNDVQNALLDIQDYVEEIYPEFQNAATPTPKTVPVIGNNGSPGSSRNIDAEVANILAIPIEEWTPEQSKLVSEFNKRNKR